MNISKISTYDIANGPGIRVSVWVSGCTHQCKGCHNPQTWNKDFGREFTENDLSDILKYLKLPYISGITFSGGDPLCEVNIEDITKIIKRIRKECYDKSIWVYTGATFEDIKDLEVLQYIDILVDGEFIEKEKDISLSFRGSRNQRIIDVQESLLYNEAIKWSQRK